MAVHACIVNQKKKKERMKTITLLPFSYVIRKAFIFINGGGGW